MKILVFTTVYPNSCQPNLGIFVHERMSRVSYLCDIRVVAPVPYFPFAGLFKEKYRHRPPKVESMDDVTVYHPRFFLIPGCMKWLDGFFLFLSSLLFTWKLRRSYRFDLIDAHFAYPDGFAAVLLGKIFHTPVTVTLRGTINRLILDKLRRPLIGFTLRHADRVFSVSRYLIDLAIRHTGHLPEKKTVVIPNGVNSNHFYRLEKKDCRSELDIPLDSRVLISVGGLVERKGHHRVLEVLPELKKKYPDIFYVIVGGGGVEGDISEKLHEIISKYGLEDCTRLTGEIPHQEVHRYLCAADVFVLPTTFEGWANVFFEAMACGLPVVTTRVCGNAEVVQEGKNGFLVPLDDEEALESSLQNAFVTKWNLESITDYACSRPWEKVAQEVYDQFSILLKKRKKSAWEK